MQHRLVLIFCWLHCLGSALHAAPSKTDQKPIPNKSDLVENKTNVEKAKNINSLTLIDSASDEASSFVYLTLNSAFESKIPDIQNHSQFLQIHLENTICPEPGKFYDIKSPFIKKAAVFQNTATSSMVRLFLDEPLNDITQAASLALVQNKLVLTLDHKTIAKIAQSQKNQVQASMNIAATTPVPTSVALNVKNEGPDLRTYLQNISIYSAALMGLLLLSLTLRRMFINRRRPLKNDQNLRMQIISQLHISPKQKLIIVKIGDENLLFSVSHDQTQLITSMGMNDKVITKAPHALESTERATSPQLKNKFVEQLRESMAQKTKQKELVQSSSEQASETKKSKHIHYAVGDQGVENRLPKEDQSSKVVKENKAIDDVTNMIREKLKFLPKTG